MTKLEEKLFRASTWENDLNAVKECIETGLITQGRKDLTVRNAVKSGNDQIVMYLIEQGGGIEMAREFARISGNKIIIEMMEAIEVLTDGNSAFNSDLSLDE